MKIITELLAHAISENIEEAVSHFDSDAAADRINKEAAEILEEIHDVLSGDFSDFDAVEHIVSIFEKHGLDSGTIHDFG